MKNLLNSPEGRVPTLVLTLLVSASVHAEEVVIHAGMLLDNPGEKPQAELRISPGADHKNVRGCRACCIDYYWRMFSWWRRFLDVPENPLSGNLRN